ncbi:MAG: MMPL family transporter [Ilumatobacteraceae bacterium]
MLASIARTCVRHKWITMGTWLALLVVINILAAGVGPDYRTDFTLPSSETKDVQELLEQNDPNRAGFGAQLVIKAEQGVADPEVEETLTTIMDFAASKDGVSVTSPYDNPEQVSQDGDIAFAQLDIRDRGFTELQDLGAEIKDFGDEQALPSGMEIEYGGDLFSTFEVPESEVLGIIAAVIILILAFGSVLAMGLPIGIALFGLGIASALVSLFSHLISMPDFTSAMVAMIGLGVGIDYALFIVTRYREGLKLGLSVEDSVAEAIDTSGRAVLFAGTTVIISLLGLLLIGLNFVNGVAVASAIGVLLMVLASLSLLPALLGWIGPRIENTTRAALGAVALAVVGALVGVLSGQGAIFLGGFVLAIAFFALSFAIKPLRKLIPHRVERSKETRLWYRWSRFIQHRPWPSALGAAAVLLLLAVPLFSIRLGFGDYGNYPEDNTVRRAYDLLAEGFGPGTNGPLFITVEGDTANDPAALDQFVQSIAGTEGVAAAFPAGPPLADGLSLVIVYPQSAPQDAETTTLVHALRDDVIPATGVDAKVGGFTAGSVDFSAYLGSRMPLLIGVVLLLSFLLLMAVFRSVLVPLKAVIMNLLSIGAAYGILVAIFQWGWGMGLIGVDKAGPIEAWVPMFLFAIVFGLSMDYEVFLLSRIKEEYDRTKQNATAVADGLAATARVITAAALIMFCVFAAFALGDDRQLKLFGLGLAIAVLIDATLVRMVLVPSTMELLGDRNWWIPKWLDKIMPNIEVEGKHHIAPIPASQLEDEGEGGDRPKEHELV